MIPLSRRTIGLRAIRQTQPRCKSSPRRTFTSSRPSHGLLGIGRSDLRETQDARSRHLLRKKRRNIEAQKRGDRKPPPKLYASPRSVRARCKDPVAAFTQIQLKTLDPTGARARLFDKRNLEGAKVGDILLVRQRSGDPYAGVCLNIRRQGVDTAILLRNNLTRVGVEMWFKIYSPNVEGVEVVQRRAKRARRARLYYMRQPKHDIGPVGNIVSQYLRNRQALRSGKAPKGRDANSHKKPHVKSK